MYYYGVIRPLSWTQHASSKDLTTGCAPNCEESEVRIFSTISSNSFFKRLHLQQLLRDNLETSPFQHYQVYLLLQPIQWPLEPGPDRGHRELPTAQPSTSWVQTSLKRPLYTSLSPLSTLPPYNFFHLASKGRQSFFVAILLWAILTTTPLEKERRDKSHANQIITLKILSVCETLLSHLNGEGLYTGAHVFFALLIKQV